MIAGKKRAVIVLCSFNGGRFIDEQIKSIQAQSHQNFDCFIFDDCSKDDTITRIISNTAGDKRFKVIQNSPPSGSASRNFIQALCSINVENKYDYVALCDQDDIWAPKKLEVAIDILITKNYHGYSCAVTPFSATHKPNKCITQSPKTNEFDFLFESAGQGCTYVFTPVIIETLRFLSSNYGEVVSRFHYHDWLVYLCARTCSYRWYFDQNSYLFYRQHNSNEIGGRRSWRGFLFRAEKLISGWYTKQLLIAYTLHKGIKQKDSSLNRTTKISGLDLLRLCYLCIRYGRRSIRDKITIIPFVIFHCLLSEMHKIKIPAKTNI